MADIGTFRDPRDSSELPHDDPTPWHLVDDTDRLASARMKVSHHFQAVRKNRIDQHRIVTIQPMQGDRQVNYRVAGIGGVLDLTCRIEWNGSARFTRLWYEVK